jgi:ElaB/YqjD/DUF883 family membrane-anchored ribosome-binding protein
MAFTTASYESKQLGDARLSTSESHGAQNSEQTADDVSKLKNDIFDLADSVRKLAAEKMESVAGDVQAKAGEKLGELETMIRKSPNQSAVVAAGLGFLVGLILTR